MADIDRDVCFYSAAHEYDPGWRPAAGAMLTACDAIFDRNDLPASHLTNNAAHVTCAACARALRRALAKADQLALIATQNRDALDAAVRGLPAALGGDPNAR